MALRKGVRTGIEQSGEYESIDACIAAGMNVQDWLSGRVLPWVQSKVIAWHRLKTLIEIHSQEAAIDEQERQAKKEKRKGKFR